MNTPTILNDAQIAQLQQNMQRLEIDAQRLNVRKEMLSERNNTARFAFETAERKHLNAVNALPKALDKKLDANEAYIKTQMDLLEAERHFNTTHDEYLTMRRTILEQEEAKAKARAEGKADIID
jgi:hypothetical protein